MAPCNTARREREALSLNMICTPKGGFKQASRLAAIVSRERLKYALRNDLLLTPLL